MAVTQTELARRVGASREKVNRKLHAWVGEGLLRLDRSGVRILSTQRLRAVAGT
ncbi:helix-turn-helix domain-containing protein [Phenylobacterium aquaticum]|nr:helix-turn-helix domain-containing protein [Phenylobacterium aquaticum]